MCNDKQEEVKLRCFLFLSFFSSNSSSVSGRNKITSRSRNGNCNAGNCRRSHREIVETILIAVVKTMKYWFHKNNATTEENKIQIKPCNHSNWTSSPAIHRSVHFLSDLTQKCMLYIFIYFFDHHMTLTIQCRGRKGCALDSNPQWFQIAGVGDTCSYTDINGSTSRSTNFKSLLQIISVDSLSHSIVLKLSRKSINSAELKAFVVSTNLINMVLCFWKQTSPQIPFKPGCGMAGRRPLGFGMGSLFPLHKREMSVQPILLEPSHQAASQKCSTDNSPHSVFNGGTQRQ